MTTIAPAGVHIWGSENRANPAGGARHRVETLHPSAYDRDLLKPEPGTCRRGLNTAPSPYRKRELRAATDPLSSSPSASAVTFIPVRVDPREYDRDLLQRKNIGRSVYANIRPRSLESARRYLRSGFPDDAGSAGVSLGGPSPARPSLVVIAETAKDLSSAVADARTRDSLDEIRQIAIALGAKLRLTGRNIEDSDDRRWQELSDSLSRIAGNLIPGAASTAVEAPGAALRAAIAGAAPRPTAVPAAVIAALTGNITALTGAMTRSRAAVASFSSSSSSSSAPLVYAPADLRKAFANMTDFLARQRALMASDQTYLDKNALAPAYCAAGFSYGPTTRVKRDIMLNEIENYTNNGKIALEEVSNTLRINFVTRKRF